MSAPQHHAAFAEVLGHPLRIGFLSPHNPFDRAAFNGTVHHAARALSRADGAEVAILGGHRPRPWHHRISRRLRPARRVALARRDFEGLDAVVGLVATGLLNEAAGLTRCPLVHVTDATPGFLREFYGREVPREADLAEARVLATSRLAVYSSRYMAERAMEEFGTILEDRVLTIPFGPNCEGLPDTLPPKPALRPLRLLWVGSKWARKGGEVALAAFDILRARGLDVGLTMVGDIPGHVVSRPGLRIVGYLDKNRPRDAARLKELYASAHLLVLPTRADCTPMVLAEAGAHGTPVIATDTGGIATLVNEGVNGRLLVPAAAPADWARAIAAMTADAASHAALCRSSFEHCQARLSWDAWARDLILRLRMEVAETAVRRAAA